MTRFACIALGLFAATIGAIKICLHVKTGAILTLEGCQGGTFTIPLGPSSVHCWGCYLAAFGAATSLLAIVWPYLSRLNIPFQNKQNPCTPSA